MKKAKSRLLVFLLTACILLMLPFSVFAAEGYLSMIDMNQYSYSFNSSYPAPYAGVSASRATRKTINGNVAYCVEFGVMTYTGIGYNSSTSWSGLSSSKQQLINYALMFGYTGSTKYGGNVDQEYWATQSLIWQIAYDTVNTSWETPINNVLMGSGSVAVSVYNQIKANVYSYQTIPSFTSTTAASAPEHEMAYNSATGKYELTLTDTRGVLSAFNFQYSGYDITRSGNTLKIETNTPQELVTVSATKSLPSVSAGIIRYWTASGYQTLVSYELGTAGVPVQAHFKLKMPIVQGVIEISKSGSVFVSVTQTETEYGTMYQPVYADKPISGVVFNVIAEEDIYTRDGKLRTAKDTVVDTVTTGGDGTATTKALYLGNYRVEEVSTARGYVLDTTSHFVNLNTEDESLKLIAESLNLLNERQTASVCFSKDMELGTMREDKPFGDVLFGLFARDEIMPGDGTVIPADGLIELITPNEYGEAVVTSDLPFGQYYVKELATSAGYILNDTEYDFGFMPADSNITVVEIVLNGGEAIYNEIMHGNVKLIKTDIAGNRLSGAVFCLFTATDILVGEYITDSNGEIYVEGLSYGEYYWQEKTAPNGYVKNNTLFQFSITEDGQETEITVINNKAGNPKTGDTGNIVLWLVVSILALTAMIGGIVLCKKKAKVKA